MAKFSFNLNVKLALVSKKETPFFCWENEIKILKTVRNRKNSQLKIPPLMTERKNNFFMTYKFEKKRLLKALIIK